jgi:hypothetical protein
MKNLNNKSREHDKEGLEDYVTSTFDEKIHIVTSIVRLLERQSKYKYPHYVQSKINKNIRTAKKTLLDIQQIKKSSQLKLKKFKKDLTRMKNNPQSIDPQAVDDLSNATLEDISSLVSSSETKCMNTIDQLVKDLGKTVEQYYKTRHYFWLLFFDES